MLFKKNLNNLFLLNSANIIFSLKKYKFINNLYYFSSTYLLEEDVGINHFMSDFLEINKSKKWDLKNKNSLDCVFKYKCEDFHVYEIDKNNNILNVKFAKKKILDDNKNVDAKTFKLSYENQFCNNYKKIDYDTTKNEKEVNEYDFKYVKNEDKFLDVLPKKKENSSKNFVLTNNDENSKVKSEYYVKFILYKVNKDTQEAIREISKASEIPIKNFHYSGFKDKRSVSTQIISTNFSYIREINNIKNLYLNKKAKKLLICNIEKLDKNIELGEHRGNSFIVVLRNVQNNEDYLRNRLDYIKKYGFINYFGMQRFGVYKNTFNKGKALISRNYKEYINFVLDPNIFEKKFLNGNIIKDSITIYMKNACNIFKKKNATFAFRYFTLKMNKLLKKNYILQNNELNKQLFSHKYFYSYMNNSEYEAFVLLRNLYIYEKNQNQENKNNINNKKNGQSMRNINIKKDEHLVNKLNDGKYEKQKYFYKNEKICVKGISMEVRRFHMHSYSAKIFNFLTSYRLENFGIKLEESDFVFTKEIQSETNEKKNQHNYITIYDNKINNLNIYNVVLPVLGSMPYRLSYLNVFKNLYRKFRGQKIRLVFLEILLYLIYILYEDNLFRLNCNIFDSFVNDLKQTNIKKSIKFKCEDILNDVFPIKKILYIIKQFDKYINSFEYEYGMTCVFRNIVVIPKNFYYCFYEYNEPKAKFISDLYSTILINKILKKEECKSYNVNNQCNNNNCNENIDCSENIEFGNNTKYMKNKNDNKNTQNIIRMKRNKNISLINKDEEIKNINFQKDSSNNSKQKKNKYKFNALILNFNLNSSSYATMLIRELYGKQNELLVHNLIKNCKRYEKKIKGLRE
ncbi:tRNA pseudouridine synthase D, putative [Plasmodium gallinaceum]|uniref:tRNA pseudouridine synthase D, putative n=1 Tax=Plasmodium gallinaceum TaxID=5849 RepID=A0A1J1GQC4_PLAGA|nr:tRNA pseudouridine synthase D, putative [Plasmodium gallinaceum]CRG93242.1 tRNA pseudouridine synthase D, putative [Plasmodium gallinaceum]